MVEINEGAIKGATWLVNEVFGRHDERTAQILHGIRWKEYYCPEYPNGWLELGMMAENPTRSSLLMKVALNLVEELPDRQQTSLILRWGLTDGRQRTLEEVGKALGGVTKERARQISDHAIRRLRHPYRSKFLKCFDPQYSTAEQVIQQLSHVNKEVRTILSRINLPEQL